MKTKKIMWTEISIIIYDKNVDNSIYEKAFDIFYKNEKKFSRFDKNSMLSKLNRNKILEVDDDFIKVLKLSKLFYKKTNWYFNPLVNLSSIWYSESFDNKNFYKKETNVDLDFDSIRIVWNKVFLKENQNLDFWGIVKGWTVDLVANFLKNNGIKYFLIDAWWDIYWTSKENDYFYIQVNNTNKILKLKNKAVCTSWTYKRTWQLGGKKYNHIIDPLSNTNNFDIKFISIVTDYTVIWDVYATACIAMGREKSRLFLKKEKIIYFLE